MLDHLRMAIIETVIMIRSFTKKERYQFMNKMPLALIVLLSILLVNSNISFAKDSAKTATPEAVKPKAVNPAKKNSEVVKPELTKSDVVKPTKKNSVEADATAGATDKEHEGMIFVKGYTKKDGTKVEGYWRKKSKKN